MKQILSLLLALAMLFSLSACGGAPSESSEEGSPSVFPSVEDQASGRDLQPITSSGRYVETNITPEELQSTANGSGTLTALYAFEENTLDLTGYYLDNCFWYHSEDQGTSWELQPLPEEWTDLAVVHLDSQGGLYGRGYTADDGSQNLYYRSPEGELTSGVLVDWCVGLRLLDSGIYLYSVQEGDPSSGSTTVKAVDAKTGETLWEHRENTVYLEWASSETQVWISDGSGVNLILDAQTGEPVGEFDKDSLRVNLSGILWADEQVYYYLADDCSLCRGIWGSETEEVILQAGEYNFATEMGSMAFPCLYTMSENLTLYLDAKNFMADDCIANLYRYSFDENASLPSQALTIWALEDDATIRQAVLSFREAHPEIQVDYQIQDAADTQSLNDALTQLNTKLLAGQGPDIILLDGLNVESYMEKGLLADLSDLYEETDFVGSTVSALLDVSGGCYVIPARFTVPAIVSDGVTLPKTLEELKDLIKSNSAQQYNDGSYPEGVLGIYGEENLPYFDLEPAELRDLMWQSSAADLVSGSAVNEENLRLWLQTLKDAGDHWDLFENEQYWVTSYSGGNGLGYGNLNVMSPNSLSSWGSGFAQAGPGLLDSVEMIFAELDSRSFCTESDYQNFRIASLPGLTEGAYLPEVMLSVSAASSNQEAAKEFIRTVLSMDVQQYTYGDGLPVLQEAMDGQLAYFADYARKQGWSVDLSKIEACFDGCTQPVIVDTLVEEVIISTACDYCTNVIDLEKAVEQVKSELALKLAEQ